MSEKDAKLSPAGLRKTVQDFKAYSAGLSIEEIQEKYNLSQVIKLASNENPLGVSPLVQKVINDRAGLVFRYPQSGNPRLRDALSAKLGVGPERIVLGNGSDELIDMLIRIRAEPGKHNIVAFEPCFSMYKLQAKLCGVEFRQTRLNEDFTFPYDALLELADENTAIIFVTSPDNPSGYAAPVREIEALAAKVPDGCLLVVDEAYIDFALPEEDFSLMPILREAPERLPNVVILRTFSKMYGLAGMRLGYGVMPEWLADYMWRTRMPFSVNLLAEEAGMAALADDDFYQATLDVTLRGRELLTTRLTDMGCAVSPSHANFLLFALPKTCTLSAKDVFEQLLAKGVIVRPLGSYALPTHLRVSIGSERENNIFLDYFQEVLKNAG